MHEALARAMAELPLVAILRGLRPIEAEAIGAALVGAGFRILEVPLNSPDPFASIRLLADAFGAEVLVGAGTVIDPDDVARLSDAGGRIVVTPHTDPRVIETAKCAGMACLPGVATPSEAFAALRAGADALKLFPAETLGPAAVKAWRAVAAGRGGAPARGRHHARQHGAVAGGGGGRLRTGLGALPPRCLARTGPHRGRALRYGLASLAFIAILGCTP